jgi:hypothetical protein
MARLSIAIIFVLSLATHASAESDTPARFRPGFPVLPPAEYDIPYTGRLTVKTLATLEELFKECPSIMKNSLACAKKYSDHCDVFLVDDKIMRAYGWTTKILLRHEIAHCNGWLANHPGALPLF